MSSFTKPLIVEVLENGRYYKITSEFMYYRENDTKSLIVVPKDFITDFATIPRIFWTILPPFGRYTKSCVLHDYLCYLNAFDLCDTYDKKYTRKEADYIFLESMKAVNVNKITRYTLFYAVRFYAIVKGLK